MVETTTVTAAPASGPRISKVVILLPQSRFDALKESLASIGVTGLTVTQVLGCGVQKGPVSYTHLDVYKRQPVLKSMRWGMISADS